MKPERALGGDGREEALGGGPCAFAFGGDLDLVDEALDHHDLDLASLDRLGGHQGLREYVAARPVGCLDGSGDALEIGDRDLRPEEVRPEWLKFRLRHGRRAVEADTLQGQAGRARLQHREWYRHLGRIGRCDLPLGSRTEARLDGQIVARGLRMPGEGRAQSRQERRGEKTGLGGHQFSPVVVQ